MKPIFFKTLIGIGLAVVILKGGLPTLLRFAFPILVVYAVLKVIKFLIISKLQSAAKNFQSELFKNGGNPFPNQTSRGSPQNNQDTIDICADCGYEKKPGHRCKK